MIISANEIKYFGTEMDLINKYTCVNLIFQELNDTFRRCFMRYIYNACLGQGQCCTVFLNYNIYDFYLLFLKTSSKSIQKNHKSKN